MNYDFDVVRILFGGEETANALFYLEVVFRTAVMYFYTIFLARMVGQGAIGQIGPFEFVLVIAIGSAAGDPMFYPEIGLIQGILVITVVILLHRAVGFVMQRSRPVELVFEGAPVQVIDQGRVLDGELGSGTLSRRELFALLRGEGVRNTGEVECAFFETNGKLSVFRRAAEKATRDGESTIPEAKQD